MTTGSKPGIVGKADGAFNRNIGGNAAKIQSPDSIVEEPGQERRVEEGIDALLGDDELAFFGRYRRIVFPDRPIRQRSQRRSS